MKPFHMWMSEQVETINPPKEEEFVVIKQGKALTALECIMTSAWFGWLGYIADVTVTSGFPESAEDVYTGFLSDSLLYGKVDHYLGENAYAAYIEWDVSPTDDTVSVEWFNKWCKPHIRFDLIGEEDDE